MMSIINQSHFSWRKVRWRVMVAGIVLAVIVWGIAQPVFLRSLGVDAINPIFSDLIAILAAGEADQLGWDVFANNPLDPLNRPHVYGPWWLVVGHLGLVRADAWWLGLMLLGGFLVVAVLVLNPRNARTAVMAVFLLASPPVLLAMERGNNDLIIFLLFVSAVWLLTRQARAGMVAGAGLLVLAAALKLYPLVALPALAVRSVSRRVVLWLVAGTATLCLLVVIESLDVYRKVAEIAPEPITIFAYGAKLSVLMLRGFPAERLNMLVGGIPLILIALGIGWRWRCEFWNMVPTTGFTAGCFVAGALAWILCYVSTTSFPYRLILLLLPARLWLARENAGIRSVAVRFQLVITMLLFWTPFSKHHLLRLNADDRLGGGSTFIWMTLGLEYALALVVSGMLGFALIGWAWRRFKKEANES